MQKSCWTLAIATIFVASPSFATGDGKDLQTVRPRQAASAPKAAPAPEAAVPKTKPPAPPTELGTDASPLVVKSIKSKDDQEHEESERASRKIVDWGMLAFNGLLALFTIGLALETRRLRLLANRQASDMQESLALSRRAGEIATALELPLFIIENHPNPQLCGEIKFSLGNHGRTPAVIASDCLVPVVDPALPEMPAYPPAACKQTSSARVVEQGHEYAIVRRSTLTADDDARVRRSQSKLVLYGYIRYTDFLKAERELGFCVSFQPKPNPEHPEVATTDGRWIVDGPAAYTYDRLILAPMREHVDERSWWRKLLRLPAQWPSE